MVKTGKFIGEVVSNEENQKMAKDAAVATGKMAAKGGKMLFDAARNEENQEKVLFWSLTISFY